MFILSLSKSAVSQYRQTTISLTFPWPMSNSMTFPGFPDGWPHGVMTVSRTQALLDHCMHTAHSLINKIHQTVNDGVAHSKNPRKCTSHVTFDLDLEHTLDAGLPGDHRVQVWWRSGHFPARRNDFRANTKVHCPYHVTFDLELDLEHTLDAGSPGDHSMQVWSRSSHLPGRRSDFRASTKVPVSRDFWPWAHPGCRLTWWPSCASLVAIGPFTWEKKRFSCQHKSACITWPLTLSTPWMHADLQSILWKFGGDPAICLAEAICAKVYRQTDGQTDRRRAPRHCISSFLEWANKTINKDSVHYSRTVITLKCSHNILS